MEKKKKTTENSGFDFPDNFMLAWVIGSFCFKLGNIMDSALKSLSHIQMLWHIMRFLSAYWQYSFNFLIDH